MTSKIINAASVTPKVVIMIPRVAGKYPFVMALYDKELIRLWPCHMVIHQTWLLVHGKSEYSRVQDIKHPIKWIPRREVDRFVGWLSLAIETAVWFLLSNIKWYKTFRAYASYIIYCSTDTLPTPTEMVEKLVRIHARNVRSLAMIQYLLNNRFLFVGVFYDLPKWSLATAPVFSRYKDPSVIDFFCIFFFSKLVDSVADMSKCKAKGYVEKKERLKERDSCILWCYVFL